MTSIEGQKERAASEGWGWGGDMATEREVLYLLTALVCVTKPNICVETGTYCGHGTKAIASGLELNERGHLWTVENDSALCEKLSEQTLLRTTFVQADSREWSADEAPEGIGFALVDCCEEAEGRLEVFTNLLPKMAPGGLLCAHDTAFYAGYLGMLSEAAERPPNVHFPALQGISLWVC